jgi:hypothetical protein
MTDSDKKQWSTPRLRIFARSRAEEAVLIACKRDNPDGGSGYNQFFAGCFWNSGLMRAGCAECSQIVAS